MESFFLGTLYLLLASQPEYHTRAIFRQKTIYEVWGESEVPGGNANIMQTPCSVLARIQTEDPITTRQKC